MITRQFKETALTSIPPYYAPQGGHPPQTALLTDRAVVTEAYTVIPKGVLRDIVTSVRPMTAKSSPDRSKRPGYEVKKVDFHIPRGQFLRS